ncbi:MAG: sigma-70 family RNA polymerase sigma factor [Armatimonadota bacterium]|nr:sigma-70 family RNA polymerase sigma factor [bacterium]
MKTSIFTGFERELALAAYRISIQDKRWMVELADAVSEVARSNDRKDFDALVQRYHKQAYNIAYRMAGNHADAEDLVQEAFIRAFRFFGQYRRELPFDSWLYKIMSNVFIDKLRRKPKAMIRSLDQPVATSEGEVQFDVADTAEGPEDAVLSREMDSRIQAALDTLPEVFRLTVIYADIEGLSYEEIAEATDTNIGTVRSRLHRGRRLLRNKLKSYASQFV